MMEMNGHVVLVMAPMGGGKGSLVAHIQSTFPQVTHTTSCTTRAPRPGEVDGVHYHFLSRAAFEQKIAEGAFIEWAEFGGNLYGTPRSEVTARLARGEVVICEIEIQGILQLMQVIPPAHRTLIYIDAGGWEVLKARALRRAPMSEEELALRHARYLEEVTYRDTADVVIQNPDGKLEEAKRAMEDVIRDISNRVHT